MTQIRRIHGVDADVADACAGIVERSPEHFTPDVPGRVRADLAVHDAWLAVSVGATGTATDAAVEGFAIVSRSEVAAEIRWLAVDPQRRGHGVGTALVDRICADLVADGISLLEAKTLDESAGYAPYEATRRFWARHGFVQIDTVDPWPDWGPGNPAAILVAALALTREPPVEVQGRP